MLFSFSYSPKAKAQCGPATVNCTWGDWIYVNDVDIPINVNGETCLIKFTYRYRQCEPSNRFEYTVWAFIWPSPPCGITSYLNNLKSTDINAYYTTLASIRTQADIPVGEHLFKKIRSESLSPSSYDCISSSGCATSGLGYIEIQSYYDKCIEFIDVYTPPNPTTGDPGCAGMTFFAMCGSSQCCIRTTQMCYDNGNVRSCVTQSTGYGSGQCSGNASFTPPTGCNIINRSGCKNVTCH